MGELRGKRTLGTAVTWAHIDRNGDVHPTDLLVGNFAIVVVLLVAVVAGVWRR